MKKLKHFLKPGLIALTLVIAGSFIGAQNAQAQHDDDFDDIITGPPMADAQHVNLNCREDSCFAELVYLDERGDSYLVKGEAEVSDTRILGKTIFWDSNYGQDEGDTISFNFTVSNDDGDSEGGSNGGVILTWSDEDDDEQISEADIFHILMRDEDSGATEEVSLQYRKIEW